MRNTSLAENDRNTITNGLRVAADQFDRHFKEMQTTRCQSCLDIPGKNGIGRTCAKCQGKGTLANNNLSELRLALQFQGQAKESRDLADRIEGAEDLILRESEIPEGSAHA